MNKIGNLTLDYIDYITVIRKDFSIAYSSRYELTGKDEKSRESIRGKNFFEVYPAYKKQKSAVITCLMTGEIVFRTNEEFVDYKGKFFCTDSIAFPIVKAGQIIGAIELSSDRTTIRNIKNKGQDEGIDLNVRDTNPFTDNSIFSRIITCDGGMQRLIERAKTISVSKAHTLIYGETGTGKELFAQAMIEYAGYPAKKVVVHNCASIPESLAESILFGSEKGAFTGAETKKGLFYEANGGVFFLDELNSLPYSVQGTLLRVLQDGKFRPVGSNREISVDVKVIAAMNIEPMEAIERKELRSDLFYRLSGNLISLIPLRKRKEDILLLFNHYLEQYSKQFGKAIKGISSGLETFMLNYPWKGNVRELKNTVESMVFTSFKDILTEEDLPGYMFDTLDKMGALARDPGTAVTVEKAALSWSDEDAYEDLDLKHILEKTERKVLLEALKKENWNISRASILLGIPRQTLKYKIDKLGLKK